MAAASSLFPVHVRTPTEEPRILLTGVPWSTYVPRARHPPLRLRLHDVPETGEERGLEPDECYSRGRDTELPEIALEVIVTQGLLDNAALRAFRDELRGGDRSI